MPTGEKMRRSNQSQNLSTRRQSLRAAAMAACAGTSMLWMVNHALATTRTFTAGTGNEWTLGANWTPTGAPVAGDDAVIPSTSTGTMTITGSNITTGDIIYSSITPQTLANGGTDATNVTLTLTGNGTAPLIDLNNGTLATQPNFTIQGANGSTGTGTLGLVLGASGDFDTTNLGPELIISANISETGGSRSINKNGTGTLIMSGANSFSGAMELTQNTAVWDYSTNTGDKIASTGSLLFNGGALILNGNATTAVNQTVSNLNVVSGQSTLSLTPIGSSLNLNIGPINRTNNGGIINFLLGNAGGTPTITTTATNNPNDGIIGGWATVGTTDWATVSGGNIVALPTASYTDQNNESSWTSEQNITNTNSGAYTGTVASNLTIGSLKFNNSAAGTVTINSGATLTIDSGGVMNTQPKTSIMGISGGNLTSGGQDLIFNNTTSSVMNVSSTITDNATGSVGLTKTGSGTLVLGGNNTFSGHVIVNGGSIAINSLAALGTGANYATITLGTNGSTIGNFQGTPLATGTLDFQFTGGVLTRPIDLGTAGGAIRGASASFGTMTTVASTISGGSLLRFGVGGTTLLSGTNTYTGQTEVQAGTLDTMTLAPIGQNSSIGTGSTDPTLLIGSGGNVATFAYSGTTDANTGRNILLQAGGTGVQIRNANTVSFNSITELSGAGSFSKGGPGTLEIIGSGSTFVSRLNIARGTYQFDDPTGLGTTGSASIDVGNGNAAALVYGGTTPVTVSRPLDSLSSATLSTFQSNITTMTLTGGFNSQTSAHEGIGLSGAGGVIFNSNIGGTGAGNLSKSGTGTAELLGNDSYLNTTISGGTLILGSSTALGTGTIITLNSSSALAMATGFTSGVTIPSPVGTPFTNNGTIDVNQGKIVVDYNSPADDRYSILKAQVVAGYNHGAWNGADSATSGVVNSSAAHAASTTQHPTGVAIAEGSVLNTPGFVAYNNSGTYGGQPVDSTSVVMGYTYEGDATMNGAVDSNDFAILAANYNKSSSSLGWTDGDFNYDGTVNALDFNLLADNYGQTQLPAALPDAALPDGAAVPSLGALVPEPTSIAGIALLSAMTLRRRRHASV